MELPKGNWGFISPRNVIMRYSIQPGDRIFIKGYGFLSFAKDMDKKLTKKISKYLRDKYSQKLLYCVKLSATDDLN